MRWRGDWVFMNVIHHRHRSCGTETVEADNKSQAEYSIKLQAARSLFGTAMMNTYISVSNLSQVKSNW